MSGWHVAFSIAAWCLLNYKPCLAHETEVERLSRRTSSAWPVYWNNETDAYKEAMKELEKDIMKLPAVDERFNSWVQLLQGLMVPALSTTGYTIVDTPPDLHAALFNEFSNKLPELDKLTSEWWNVPDVYFDPGMKPKWLPFSEELQSLLLNSLLPLAESWLGIPLVKVRTYGLRIYLNGSSMAMHRDKLFISMTLFCAPQLMNPIGAIVHIDHEYDDDNVPFHLHLEDRATGNILNVSLVSGQTLLYEGSRLLHGRRNRLRGRYYTSMFGFFKPSNHVISSIDPKRFADEVPPHWHEGCVEQRGSRFSGEAITTDNLIAEGAPPRIVDDADDGEKARYIDQFPPPLIQLQKSESPPPPQTAGEL